MIRPDLSKLPAWGRERTPSWLCRPATALWLLLLTHAAMLGWSATKQSPTIDEPNHLAAGVSHWRTGSFSRDPGNPPLVKLVAAAPVMFFSPELPESSGTTDNYGRQFVVANGIRTLWLVTVGRWACIPFSLLGGYMCFRWARDLYGDRAGLLACLLWCFCPEVIAHGQLITADVPAAAIGVLTMYAFWKWLGQPTVSGAVKCGLLLGVAQLTRYVLVVLFLLWPVVWVCWRFPNLMSQPRRILVLESPQLAVMFLLSLYVINLGYGFEGSFAALGTHRFHSRFFQSTVALSVDPAPADLVRTSAWARAPVPLPYYYLNGIDQARSWLEGAQRCYLHGEWRKGGWWYYYLYGLAVKLSPGTIAILAVAIGVLTSGTCGVQLRKDELLLLVCASAILLFVTWTTIRSVQYLRYALPALPFAFIFCGGTSRLLTARHGAWRFVVAPLVFWAIASGVGVFPHAGSYFNVLAGGPTRGHEHLLDSSIDWGQDLLYLKEYVDDHPEISPLHLAYFGSVNPDLVGLDYSAIARDGPEPGWYAISVNLLYGHLWEMIPGGSGEVRGVQLNEYVRFRDLEPVAMAGYSIGIYDVSRAQADEMRKRWGSAHLAVSGQMSSCRAESAASPTDNKCCDSN